MVEQTNAKQSLEQGNLVRWSVIAGETLTVLMLLFLMHRLQQAAQKSRVRASGVETIHSASPAPAILFDPNGMVIRANETAVVELCGENNELGPENHDFTDCITNAEQRVEFRRQFAMLFAASSPLGERRMIELELNRANGETFRAELSLQKVIFEDQQAAAGFLRDVEAQLLAEEELIQTRDAALAADKAKSRFLKMISHESRTPLQGLYGAMEVLENSPHERAKTRALNAAKASVDVLSRHVEDILSHVSNSSAGFALDEDSFDIASLFGDLKGILRKKILASNRQVKFVNETSCEFIKGDRARLRQVLICLINNSLKFTDAGEITIGAREITTEDDRVEIEFHVADNGVGIARKDRNRIFEEFVSLTPDSELAGDGMGLGLAISQKIVRLFGGSIKLESELGAGA
ncbi:MAG: HAMP domain-containing sensor histidine kinase [Pseudomonadota bacterium]